MPVSDAATVGVQADVTDLAEHVDEVIVKASPRPAGDLDRFFMLADGVRYGPYAEVHVGLRRELRWEGSSDFSIPEPQEARLDGQTGDVMPLRVMTYFPLSQ